MNMFITLSVQQKNVFIIISAYYAYMQNVKSERETVHVNKKETRKTRAFNILDLYYKITYSF